MKYVESAQGVLKKMEAYASSNHTEAERKPVLAGAEAYLKTLEKLAGNISNMLNDYPKMRKAAHDIESLTEKLETDVMTIVEAKQAQAIAEKKNTILFLYVICGIITLVGIGLAFFSVRAITRPVNRIIRGLSEGAAQVSSAAGQVSSSSQSLAEGSSEQAASIEETSASMEEMSSMTAKNTENASHADNLMKETNRVVSEANTSMDRLTVSMEEISKASDETFKIIKTIDEIAFQTNLLALNAAVEAARAGEAGAGFAVVADEVRNLAMRAADAAKDTAQLIEGTVKKISDGSDLVAATNESFDNVAQSSEKVGNLIAEISEASREQSSGIDQVNTAINEMDKIIQQNAANAEESASATEELNAQAERLKEYVGDLVALVTGKRDQLSTAHKKEKSAPIQQGTRPAENRNKMLTPKKEVKPDQVIPFDDDDDFRDF